MPKKFFHCCKASELHVRLPSLGILQRYWGSQRNLSLNDSGILLQEFHRIGEIETPRLRGHEQNLACTKTQRKAAVTPQETEPKLPAIVEGLLWRCGSAGAHDRDTGTGNSSLGR